MGPTLDRSVGRTGLTSTWKVKHPADGSPESAIGDQLRADWVDLERVSLRFVHLARELGQPLVLLHEMGGTLETWDLTLPLLSERHQVLAYDWRGFGHSEKVKGSVELDDHVSDLEALLEARGISGQVILAGVAVGAAIASGFAARNPERVAGLVQISPALDVARADRAARLASIAVFRDQGMRAAVEASLAGGYPDRFRNKSDGRFEQFRARWLANDPESFAATYQMLVDLDIDPILDLLRCPVLLIAGEYDPVRSPDYVQTVADRIPSARMVVVPGGHHMPHQIPDLVAENILSFAGSLSGGES